MKTAFLWATDTDGWDFNLAREADRGRFGRDALFGVCVQAYWYVFLLMAVLGIAVAIKNGMWRRPSALVFLGTFVYWLAVHFVFFGEGRYHYPLVPLLAAFAALAISRLPASPSEQT